MDWAEYLTHFTYLVEGLKDYRDELSKKHSDIDQKICDILHYIELCETDDNEAADLVELLRVCRENRRDIKDELTKEEQDKVTAWWKDPYKTYFPGATETLQDVADRAEAWRRDLPKDGRVIAFSHGGIIRTILWGIVGPPKGQYQWSMELGNTGVVRLRYHEDFPCLLSFNDMSHIKDAWALPPAQNVPGSP